MGLGKLIVEQVAKKLLGCGSRNSYKFVMWVRKPEKVLVYTML